MTFSVYSCVIDLSSFSTTFRLKAFMEESSVKITAARMSAFIRLRNATGENNQWVRYVILFIAKNFNETNSLRIASSCKRILFPRAWVTVGNLFKQSRQKRDHPLNTSASGKSAAGPGAMLATLWYPPVQFPHSPFPRTFQLNSKTEVSSPSSQRLDPDQISAVQL